VRTQFDNLGMARGGIASVEIPLIGYEGASKTKFSERPVFVDGGGRIVEEADMSQHDEKLLAARQRRQRQQAQKRGGSSAANPTFSQVQNFGSGGVVGFLVQSGATGQGGTGAGAARAAAANAAPGVGRAAGASATAGGGVADNAT
jgi:hypothetical protein